MQSKMDVAGLSWPTRHRAIFMDILKQRNFFALLIGLDLVIVACTFPFIYRGQSQDLWQALSGSGFNSTYLSSGWNYALQDKHLIKFFLPSLFSKYFAPLLLSLVFVRLFRGKEIKAQKNERLNYILLWFGTFLLSCMISGFFSLTTFK